MINVLMPSSAQTAFQLTFGDLDSRVFPVSSTTNVMAVEYIEEKCIFVSVGPDKNFVPRITLTSKHQFSSPPHICSASSMYVAVNRRVRSPVYCCAKSRMCAVSCHDSSIFFTSTHLFCQQYVRSCQQESAQSRILLRKVAHVRRQLSR